MIGVLWIHSSSYYDVTEYYVHTDTEYPSQYQHVRAGGTTEQPLALPSCAARPASDGSRARRDTSILLDWVHTYSNTYIE